VLPDGWYSEEWSFSQTTGAEIDKYLSGLEPPYSYSASMGSGVQPEVWYFVPDGTDSLLIHIEHDFIAGGSIFGEAYIDLNYLSGPSTTLFYANMFYLGYSTSDPIDVVIPSPSADTWIGFTIHGDIEATYSYSANIEWHITNLSVTAYGDALELDAVSWGAIKQL